MFRLVIFRLVKCWGELDERVSVIVVLFIREFVDVSIGVYWLNLLCASFMFCISSVIADGTYLFYI